MSEEAPAEPVEYEIKSKKVNTPPAEENIGDVDESLFLETEDAPPA